jgi:hypothetical protein
MAIIVVQKEKLASFFGSEWKKQRKVFKSRPLNFRGFSQLEKHVL